MDTTKLFGGDCVAYEVSSETQTTIIGQFLITIKCFFRMFTCVAGDFLLYIFWRAFKCRSAKDISDQVALVTGGGNGLGRAIALRLAKEKCHLAIVDMDIEAAEKTAADVLSLGVKAKAYKVDVSNYEHLVNLKSEITKDLGCVSILVNNAALVALVPMCNTPKDRIQRLIDVNISSQIWTIKIFLDNMIDRGKGHIVQICSIYGLIQGKSTMYSMSKHAIHAFVSCLREEIYSNKWQDKIKITCVYPFFIATRKELTDLFQKDSVIINSPDYAADEIVRAIKNEEECISIPKGYYTLMRMFSLFPSRSIRKFYSSTFGEGNSVF
ncbi:protein dhs-3-like [Phlebotomus argentipes]|uniref:protein dhs-3-like n=1 Tax=Phlebotomus argentipes TaxID=94469 RepID=UPI0028937771|nr:protein dhs-3-like [Phlebotomus argentipes]